MYGSGLCFVTFYIILLPSLNLWRVPLFRGDCWLLKCDVRPFELWGFLRELEEACAVVRYRNTLECNSEEGVKGFLRRCAKFATSFTRTSDKVD